MKIAYTADNPAKDFMLCALMLSTCYFEGFISKITA